MLKAYESVKEKEKLCLKKRKICMFLLLFFIVCEKQQFFSKTIAENIYEKRKTGKRTARTRAEGQRLSEASYL